MLGTIGWCNPLHPIPTPPSHLHIVTFLMLISFLSLASYYTVFYLSSVVIHAWWRLHCLTGGIMQGWKPKETPVFGLCSLNRQIYFILKMRKIRTIGGMYGKRLQENDCRPFQNSLFQTCRLQHLDIIKDSPGRFYWTRFTVEQEGTY